jgi:hypothetical protein
VSRPSHVRQAARARAAPPGGRLAGRRRRGVLQARGARQSQRRLGAHARDADGDGVYCESLLCPCSSAHVGAGSGEDQPGSGSEVTNPAGCVRPRAVQSVTFSATKYPNVRRHFLDALRKGWPRTLVLNRRGPRRVAIGCSRHIQHARGLIATSIRPRLGAAPARVSSGGAIPAAGGPTCAMCPRTITARTVRRWRSSCGAFAMGRGLGTCSTEQRRCELRLIAILVTRRYRVVRLRRPHKRGVSVGNCP